MSRVFPLDFFSFDNRDFWAGFLAGAFPTALDEDTDMSIAETLREAGLGSISAWDEFTGYYDGVLDESDGYVDNPACFEYALTPDRKLRIDFHPGDIVYSVNGKQIGCTGGEYSIQVFGYGPLHSWAEEQSNQLIYLLLLPLAAVEAENADAAKDSVSGVLRKIFGQELAERLAGSIVYGLCEE